MNRLRLAFHMMIEGVLPRIIKTLLRVHSRSRLEISLAAQVYFLEFKQAVIQFTGAALYQDKMDSRAGSQGARRSK